MLFGSNYSTDENVADKGEQIYKDLFQRQFEKEYSGQYLAIDVLRKRAYVANTAADAVIKAKVDAPEGLFHLIKIAGSPPKGLQSYLMKLLGFMRGFFPK